MLFVFTNNIATALNNHSLNNNLHAKRMFNIRRKTIANHNYLIHFVDSNMLSILDFKYFRIDTQ